MAERVRSWTIGEIRLRALTHEPLPSDETKLVETEYVVEALIEYGDHRGNCNIEIGDGGSCDCGFDATLTQLSDTPRREGE